MVGQPTGTRNPSNTVLVLEFGQSIAGMSPINLQEDVAFFAMLRYIQPLAFGMGRNAKPDGEID